MSRLQSSLRKEKAPLPYETPTLSHYNSSDVLLSELKANYEERLQSLENQFKDVYRNIQNDELLSTMGLSEFSKEFRTQRIQELVEDSLLTEKEAQIRNLTEMNACLKTDLLLMENRFKELEQSSVQEQNKLQSKIDELSEEIKEYANIKKELTLIQNECDHILRQRGREFDKNQQYENKMVQLNYEFEELERVNKDLQYSCIENEKMYNEVKGDLEVLQNQYFQVEQEYTELKSENNKLKKSLKELEEIRETNKVYEKDLKNLQERLKESENELKTTKEKLQEISREKSTILVKSETFSTQAKQIVENEQKILKEKIEEMKEKYKPKIKKYKEKTKELTESNETLNNEINKLRKMLEESKKEQEKLKISTTEEMKILETTWNKKYNELQSSSQKAMVELNTQYQSQLKSLETHYQEFVEIKLAEAEQMATDMTSKTISIEVEDRVQSRLEQIERDYIPKIKHENILEIETWNLRNMHNKEIQALYQEFQRELDRKTRNIQESEQDEYNMIIDELQNRRKILEEEAIELKDENQRLIEKQNEHIRMIKGLKEELEDAMNKIKNLTRNLDENSQNLIRIKALLEVENRKCQKLEEGNKELSHRTGELLLKKDQLEYHINQLREELKGSSEAQSAVHEQLANIKRENEVLSQEIEALKKKSDEDSQAKNESSKEIEHIREETNKEILKLEQKIDEFQKEIENKNKFIKNLRESNEKLGNTVEILQLKEKEFKIESSSLQSDRLKLEAQLANQAMDYKLNVAKVWKLASAQIQYIKKEIENIKSSAKFEIEVAQKVTKAAIEDFSNNIVSKMRLDDLGRAQKDAEKAETHRKEIEKFKECVENHIQQNVDLVKENQKLDAHLVQALDTLEESTAAIEEYKAQIERLNQEIVRLKEQDEEKKEEIRQINKYVNSEINNVREDLKALLPEVAQQLQSEYKNDIKKLMQDLSLFKETKINRLADMKKHFEELEKAYNQSLEEIRDDNEERRTHYEITITALKNEIETSSQENIRVRDELRKYKEKHYELEKEHAETIRNYQNKVKEIEKIIKERNEEMKNEEARTVKETEKLRKDLKEAKLEISLKEEELRHINAIRVDQQECIVKYRSLLEQKQKLAASSKENKFGWSGKSSEMGIKDLQSTNYSKASLSHLSARAQY